MVGIIKYPEVLTALAAVKRRYLILGNGFSIAAKPDIFTYDSLYENAGLRQSAPHLIEIFESLGTKDFEIVIRQLAGAAKIIQIYAPAQLDLIHSLEADAAKLKEILVSAIAERHPNRPYDIEPERYVACRKFLHGFHHTYTLNYDVLLYWALMQEDLDDLHLLPDDGFRHPEDDPDEPYVSWQESQKPTVHYMHGALHLFDAGSELIKYTWSKTDIPIVEQIRAALAIDNYPLFVTEGSSESKVEKIMHNAYLHKALRSLEGSANTKNAAIVVYGHSLAENDGHVFKQIEKGKVPQLFVSIYGDPSTEENRKIIEAANGIAERRAMRRAADPLEVIFFDAASAKVWDP